MNFYSMNGSGEQKTENNAQTEKQNNKILSFPLFTFTKTVYMKKNFQEVLDFVKSKFQTLDIYTPKIII